MPKITFLPVNMICEAQPGESILDIAINNDVPLQHACGGFCACTTCNVMVKEGDDHLSPMGDDERERLDQVCSLVPHSRLGCQAKVHGDVTVEILNLE